MLISTGRSECRRSIHRSTCAAVGRAVDLKVYRRAHRLPSHGNCIPGTMLACRSMLLYTCGPPSAGSHWEKTFCINICVTEILYIWTCSLERRHDESCAGGFSDTFAPSCIFMCYVKSTNLSHPPNIVLHCRPTAYAVLLAYHDHNDGAPMATAQHLQQR